MWQWWYIDIEGQIRWFAVNGIVGLALIWVFNCFGMENRWVVFSTPKVGYVLLALVVIIMISVFERYSQITRSGRGNFKKLSSRVISHSVRSNIFCHVLIFLSFSWIFFNFNAAIWDFFNQVLRKIYKMYEDLIFQFWLLTLDSSNFHLFSTFKISFFIAFFVWNISLSFYSVSFLN